MSGVRPAATPSDLRRRAGHLRREAQRSLAPMAVALRRRAAELDLEAYLIEVRQPQQVRRRLSLVS